MKFWKIGGDGFLALHNGKVMGVIRPSLMGEWSVKYRSSVSLHVTARLCASLFEAKRFCREVLTGRYAVEPFSSDGVDCAPQDFENGMLASLGYCEVSLCYERARFDNRLCDWHYGERRASVLTARYGVDALERWNASAVPDSVGSVVVVARLMEGEAPPVERWPTRQDLRDDMASRWDFARALYVSPDYAVFVEAAVTPKPTSSSEMQRAWRDVSEFIDCHFDIPMDIYRIDEFNPGASCHIDPFGRGVFARAESEVDPMNWD